MICSMMGNASMVEKLLAFGADINKQNNSGKTALMLASFYGNSTTVKILLKNGAKKNIKDNQNWQAIDFAKAKQKNDVASILSK